MTTNTDKRAYTVTEREHNDHVVLDREHHNAPKDGNDDPVFEQ